MASLGSYGEAPAEVETDTFTYFGVDLRINPEVGELAYVDFMEANGKLDWNDPSAMVAMKDFLRVVVHPEDFEQFWSLAKVNRQGIWDLAPMAMELIEASAGRPTGRSSDSSTGPSETGENSTDASYSRVIQEHEAEGRPDLAEIYDIARTARQAS